MNDIRKYWDKIAEVGPDRSVIDQKDKRGNKIKYINSLRDRAILDAMNDVSPPARILDFGCGSGNLSKTLENRGYSVTGVDISMKLLHYAQQRQLCQHCLFVQYDGSRLPFPSNCFDACVSFEVLQHMTDTDLFRRTLDDIDRVLKPGGWLIAVEQTRRKGRLNPREMKLQRSTNDYLQLFSEAGFCSKKSRIIRRGHFPLIYAIRYGLISPKLFPHIANMERFLGRVFRNAFLDYADTIFVLEKQE